MREDWEYEPLGNVCDVIGGGTPSKRNPAFYEGDIPWASVRDMRNEFLSSTEFCISSEAIASSSTKVIPERNVVIATRVGLGKVCVLQQDTAINQDLRGIIPKNGNLDIRYLFRWFQSIASLIEGEGTGATVKGVKLPFIKSLRLPLPPLQEQKRIVAILDEAFAGIDAAITNTEKNLSNARELFESYLNSVFGSKLQWSNKKLEDVVESSCKLSYGIVQPGKEVADGLPVVRPTDLSKKTITLDGLKRIDPGLAYSYQRTTLTGSELLLCVRGSTGAISVSSEELKGANVTRGIVPIRFDPSLIFDEFGYYLMRSPSIQDQIKEKTYGAALMQINIRDLRKIVLKVPRLETQKSIVASLDEISPELSKLESIYIEKLKALAELKQSLLQKAFSGELTAEFATKEMDEAVA
jgi:type I restriction enzyme S subunit